MCDVFVGGLTIFPISLDKQFFHKYVESFREQRILLNFTERI